MLCTAGLVWPVLLWQIWACSAGYLLIFGASLVYDCGFDLVLSDLLVLLLLMLMC